MIYNLGNGQGLTVRHVGPPARHRAAHSCGGLAAALAIPRFLIPGSAKIETELGWKPNFSQLDDILRSARKWRRRRSTLSAIIS